jgi:hypothetical protein
MNHIFQEYNEYFEIADYIIIERQPIQGMVGIEQLIFSRYRNKSHLAHPSSMHKHFRLGHLDYDQRKSRTIKIAEKHLTGDILDQFRHYPRNHDISDSICIVLFWLSRKHSEWIEKERRKEADEEFEKHRGLSLDDYFGRFRYTG